MPFQRMIILGGALSRAFPIDDDCSFDEVIARLDKIAEIQDFYQVCPRENDVFNLISIRASR